MRLRRRVDLAERRAGLDARGARLRIDADRPHLREVDEHRRVGDGEAGDLVPAAAHAEEQVVVAGEADRGHHVGGVRGADHERRAAVDHRVPERAGLVVARLPGQRHAAGHAAAKSVDGGVRDMGATLIEPSDFNCHMSGPSYGSASRPPGEIENQ